MEYVVDNPNNELYHHGIKGMRWGIRRFQNKDGSLTPAGQKRRAKLEAELKQLGGKKTVKKPAQKTAQNNTKKNASEAPRPKTVSEMSDDELRAHTNRMQLEANYYNSKRALAIANPRQVSKGERFVNGLMNDVIAPAAKNAGRAYLEKFMKDKLGLNQEDPIGRLEKQVKKLELTKKIEDLKKGKSDNNYSLDELLEAYRNIPEDTRKELADAAKIQENLNKVNKKKN